jgi:LysM repeat protein
LFSSSSSSHDQTGAVAQSAPAGHVESQPLPHLAAADSGAPGGPASPLRTASAAPPNWTWEGGTAITIRPGETLDTVSREHGVPVSAIMQANNIARASDVYAGERLVIPQYRSSVLAAAPRQAQSCLPPSDRRAKHSWRRRACTSFRQARRSTVSRGAIASR